jgi:hypothetical protein
MRCTVALVLLAGLVAAAAGAAVAVAAEHRGAAVSPRRERVLTKRVRADLEKREPNVWLGATSSPLGGLSKDGTCSDGRRAVRLDLFLPPPNSADMFTDIGFVCRSTKRYWVNRTGGFAATDVWIGPFPVPAARTTQSAR